MSVCFIGWHACWRCARAAGLRPSGWVVWIGDADRQWIQIQVWWPLVWRCACGWPTRLGSISAQRTPRRERSRSPFGSVVKAGEPCRGLAWGGEPESLDVGNLWPRKERGNLRVPRGVRLGSPAHRVGRRPPPPGWGGGGVRPVAPASKPESERTSRNAAPYDPARIVQGDEGVGVRIHQRLRVVGRTVEHPSL